jgi:fructose-1,6-bisphosphatase I
LEQNTDSIPNRIELIEIIGTIADSTIPIRGLLEKGITSREIQQRMNINNLNTNSKNLYDEDQIHEDILTHSIILNAIQEENLNYIFVASEEAKPVLGSGHFGITIDPVDGSSNVVVNRTVGTIVGIYNEEGAIICSFYVLYGIFTNLIIALNNKVAEFTLDTSPYSMTFYHYVFQELISLPKKQTRGIRCLGGDSSLWSDKCKAYEKLLVKKHYKDRYSGSFVGDFHAILTYGGVYSYFPSPNPKIRLYYEWLPLAFIIKTLHGEFFLIGSNRDRDEIRNYDTIKPLTKETINKIHTSVSGGIIGSKETLDLFLSLY